MSETIPANAAKYAETQLFTQDTVPDTLRRDHTTKPDVWGRIVVEEGVLLYLRADRPAQRVTPANPATILPQENHSVATNGTVRFRVEFYRLQDRGAA